MQNLQRDVSYIAMLRRDKLKIVVSVLLLSLCGREIYTYTLIAIKITPPQLQANDSVRQLNCNRAHSFDVHICDEHTGGDWPNKNLKREREPCSSMSVRARHCIYDEYTVRHNRQQFIRYGKYAERSLGIIFIIYIGELQ